MLARSGDWCTFARERVRMVQVARSTAAALPQLHARPTRLAAQQLHIAAPLPLRGNGGNSSSNNSGSRGVGGAAALVLRGSSHLRVPRLQVRACSGGEGGEEQESFTVTTPLFYVNAPPHMGSAYPTIAADAAARFQRLRGKNVRFVTGTDEHGEKIAQAAAKNGYDDPQQHCDAMAALYQQLWAQLEVEYDSFVRTTQPKHEALVREFLQRVWDKGDIYKASYEGRYCVGCEEYKDEQELLEGHRCPVHLTECEERKEENYFFRLSAYQKELEHLLQEQPDFCQPEARRNEVLSWVRQGLRDFSISRAAVKWGIPIPQEPEQTVYVWFDALTGYLSALLEEEQQQQLAASGEADGHRSSSSGSMLEHVVASGSWPASAHLIGKDILRFHVVYWPAMLMSAGLPLPKRVYGHGFLTKDGLKMGKSLGNVLEPTELTAQYGADAVRFYFLKEIQFGLDGDFAVKRFIDKVNDDLANDMGNLLNRSLGLLKKKCAMELPCDAAQLPEDLHFRTLVPAQVAKCADAYENFDYTAAAEAALTLTREGNKYFNVKEPWSLLKTEEGKEEGAQTLLTVLELVRITAILMSPITPTLSHKIYTQLGYTDEEWQQVSWEADTNFGGLVKSRQPNLPSPIFARLEYPEEAEELQKA